MQQQEFTIPRPEDVLPPDELEFFHFAREGRYRCPNCTHPLTAEVVYIPPPEAFAGVRLYCQCGFEEP